MRKQVRADLVAIPSCDRRRRVHRLPRRPAAVGTRGRVVGVDSFTPYYDVALKDARAAELLRDNAFALERIDLADEQSTRALFERVAPKRVIHLAAQPGVRRALTEPEPYVVSNVAAFLNILEGCRHAGVQRG